MDLMALILIITIPALAVLVWVNIVSVRKGWGWDSEFFLIVLPICIGLLLSVACTAFALRTNVLYGIIHGIISYGAVVILSLRLDDKLDNLSVMWGGLVLSAAGLVVAIPLGVMPVLRPSMGQREVRVGEYAELDIEFVRNCFSKIKGRLLAVEEGVKEERRVVAREIDALVSNLEKRNKELQLMRSEQEVLKEEIEQYKKLASVTQEQANAITEALGRGLKRGRYFDYLIGFVIGLASTSVFYIIRRFVELKQRRPTV